MSNTVSQTSATAPPPFRWSFRQFVLAVSPAFALSCASSLVCGLSSGLTLGSFLGPVLLCPLLVPAVVVAEDHFTARLSALLGVILGVAVVWCGNSLQGHVLGGHVVGAMSVLSVWAVWLAGLTLMLNELRLPSVLASAVTAIVGLVWVTWPVWLSAPVVGHDRAVGYLADVSPLLSVNWAVEELGLWSSPMGGTNLAYNYLTNLNQDVAYPSGRQFYSVWLTYGCGGGILLIVSLWLEMRRTRLHPSSANVNRSVAVSGGT